VKQYFCSCCDKMFEKNTIFFSVRDGKRLLLLHKECVPVFSDGLEIEEIEEKMGVKIKNKVEIVVTGNVYWRKPGTGVYHREGGPAVEWVDGSKFWYVDGKRHREDGPTVIRNGGKEWWLEGKLHRTDGPAVVFSEGDKEWWLEGKIYTEKEHRAEMKRSIDNRQRLV